MEDKCLCCGEYVPEGIQVCKYCKTVHGEEWINYKSYQSPKVEIHSKICNILNDIYEKKNHDYGDSFAKLGDYI